MSDSANDLVMIEIEKRNPYLAYNKESGVLAVTNGRLTDNDDVNVITTDNLRLVLNRNLAERAIFLDKYAFSVRFLCIIDMVMNILYLYVGYGVSFIFILCSICGYISTNNYYRRCLMFYLTYQYIQVLLRLISMVALIALASNKTLELEFHQEFPQYELSCCYTSGIILTSLLFFMQTYICGFIQKYYNMLPSRNNRQMMTQQSIV
jgi:hypothetical protein